MVAWGQWGGGVGCACGGAARPLPYSGAREDRLCARWKARAEQRVEKAEDKPTGLLARWRQRRAAKAEEKRQKWCKAARQSDPARAYAKAYQQAAAADAGQQAAIDAALLAPDETPSYLPVVFLVGGVGLAAVIFLSRQEGA